MTPRSGDKADWLATIRRFLILSGALHLVWEIVQLPLYTIWAEPIKRQAFAVLHCTAGDVMISGLSMLAALLLVGRPDWPKSSARSVFWLMLFVGLSYTAFSEWLNVNVRGNWAYSALMPTLPILGTGLAPLFQWIVIPGFVQRLVVGHWPWR